MEKHLATVLLPTGRIHGNVNRILVFRNKQKVTSTMRAPRRKVRVALIDDETNV